MFSRLFRLAAVNWRTTLFGVLAFISLASGQVSLYFDEDPATSPDWNLVAAGFATLLVALRARDDLASSEDQRRATKVSHVQRRDV